MGQLVAGMLHAFDSLGIRTIVVVLVSQHLLQLASRRRDVERHLREQIKILFFFRKQANQTHSTPISSELYLNEGPDYNL